MSRLDEESLESTIVADMTSDATYGGWTQGDPHDLDRAYALDVAQLDAFLADTQPEVRDALDLRGPSSSAVRHEFLSRLQGEITRRGVVAVLRDGVQHRVHRVDLYYPLPSAENPAAAALHTQNRFTVTRQVHYSTANENSLDLVTFVNGLPVATFELKNQITKQTVEDAIAQYRVDRDPRELIFGFARTIAHFAVDDKLVRFCTRLAGTKSWFLPFDQGWDDGAGNPPNPDGLMTDYLWRRILTPASLANILESFAQRVTTKNAKTGKKSEAQIFPRYHQLDVVRRLLADVEAHGAGKTYLVQHSAGSGKSNSIAWLAHQLTGVRHAGRTAFDSVIIATDRRILDSQIRDTVKSFTQVGSTVVHALRSADLRHAIEAGAPIVVTTIQKFPYVVDGIGAAQADRRFAVIIDEAHSSQGGKTAGKLAATITGKGAPGSESKDLAGDDEALEDAINRLIDARKLATNASYFAFTATPKNKTLETFGEPYQDGGEVKYRPFHSYTMKQAIQERFILDVLANYVEVASYYKLVKTVQDDPEFDLKRASKKLRAYVEGNAHAIRQKAEIIVDHFHEQVIAKHKIGGSARAMVVASSIDRAIEYYEAISAYLVERKSPYRAIVAFSDVKRDGKDLTESQFNGFPSAEIADRIQTDPYRFLVCADKFQTGYDEPLLHSMYVDKPLSGVKAVQTLSRLNRAHPQKHDVAVLDFANDSDVIERAFQDYYRTTVLAEATDPNKLHDLANDLSVMGVFTSEHVERFVTGFLAGAPRHTLDPVLDACAAEYIENLDTDDQIAFKSKGKAFTRTYDFLAGILPYGSPAWEKLSIFLDNLLPKLPAPKEDDLSAGILENIDLDSYRAEKRDTMAIVLADGDAELAPVPLGGGGVRVDPELERLSSILDSFNAQFGNIAWDDEDRVREILFGEVPRRVAEDPAYRNAQAAGDEANARIESDKALGRVMLSLMRDNTQLFKQFSDNDSFKRWLAGMVFDETYPRSA